LSTTAPVPFAGAECMAGETIPLLAVSDGEPFIDGTGGIELDPIEAILIL